MAPRTAGGEFRIKWFQDDKIGLTEIVIVTAAEAGQVNVVHATSLGKFNIWQNRIRAIRRQIAEECDLRKITEHAKEVTRRFLGQPKLSAV